MNTDEQREYFELKHLYHARKKFNQAHRKYWATPYEPPMFNELCGYWEFSFNNFVVCENTEAKCFEEMRRMIILEERAR